MRTRYVKGCEGLQRKVHEVDAPRAQHLSDRLNHAIEEHFILELGDPRNFANGMPRVEIRPTNRLRDKRPRIAVLQDDLPCNGESIRIAVAEERPEDLVFMPRMAVRIAEGVVRLGAAKLTEA